MGLDIAAFDAALKVHYTADRVLDLSYKDHSLLAMVAKYTRFGGKNLPIPIRYARTQGRSRQFASAQTVAAASSTYLRVEDFTLTRVKDYAVAQIDGETMDAAMGDQNAFFEAASEEIDSAFEQISASLAHAMYRSGTGQIGSFSAGSNPATATITLGDINDIVHFEVGMALELWDNSATNFVQAGTFANGVVSAVNRDTGTVTLPTTWNGAFGIPVDVANDTIFVYGDGLDAGAAQGFGKVSGLDAWVPSTAPTSTAFFGVDRSVDVSRLGGIRSDGSSKDPETAHIDALTRAHREQGRTNYFFETFEDWATLEKTLGSKVQYVRVQMTPTVGFTGLRIVSPKGEAYVIPDQDAIVNVAYGLDMRTWKLYSLGMAPRMLSRDGLRVLRQSAADGVEARIGYYAQLGCRAPGFNVRLALPS